VSGTSCHWLIVSTIGVVLVADGDEDAVSIPNGFRFRPETSSFPALAAHRQVGTERGLFPEGPA